MADLLFMNVLDWVSSVQEPSDTYLSQRFNNKPFYDFYFQFTTPCQAIKLILKQPEFTRSLKFSSLRATWLLEFDCFFKYLSEDFWKVSKEKESTSLTNPLQLHNA